MTEKEFLEKVNNRIRENETEMLASLSKLISIPSVAVEAEGAGSPAPFGEGVDRAYRLMLDMAKEEGFDTFDADGYGVPGVRFEVRFTPDSSTEPEAILTTGWDGTAASGAASAFDGNPATFFDPLGVGDGYCGMQFDEPYILEKVAILSRSGWLDRFAGACIEGSNNGEDWETIWESDEAAASETEYTVVTEGDFENNYGYTMFRYYNYLNHGDVAEVEFYGKPGKVDPPAKEEEPAPEPEPEPETPTTVEEVVENAAENVTEAAENVAEAAGDAVENAAEAVTGAVDNAAKKSGCGSFIGGGLIVLVTVLGSAWIAKRK